GRLSRLLVGLECRQLSAVFKMEGPGFDLYKTSPTLAEEAKHLFGRAGDAKRALTAHYLDQPFESIYLRAVGAQKIEFHLQPLHFSFDIFMHIGRDFPG